MRNRYRLILLAILLLSFGCKKDNRPQTFTSSSYPLAVGNWWQYQLTDFYLGGGVDTFTLKVDSIATIGPYSAYFCNYVGYGSIIPAGYFLKSDTSMSFVQPYGYFTSFPSFHLIFPVETGQYWPGSFPGDSTLVVGVAGNCDGSYGESFSPCYSTVESYGLPHNFKVNRMLLTPKVGLIEQNISFNSDTAGKTATYSGGIQIQQSIALISYHVQ